MIDWSRYKEQVDLNVFKKVFSECINVGNEQVMIIGDYGVKNHVVAPILTNAYALAARELNLNYNVLMQNAKGRGDFADEVMIGALKKLPKGSLIVLNVSNRIGNLRSLGLSFRAFCNSRGHKFITSSSLGAISNDGLKTVIKTIDVDYKRMHARGERVKKYLDSGSKVQVVTKLGTDFTMDIKGVKGIINSGDYTAKGSGGNLPAGEVYLYPNPDTAEGVFYIDGSIRLRNKTLLVRNPVKVEVEKGEIVNVSGNYEGNLFKETIGWAHRSSKKPGAVRQIAELGIGINPNAKIIGATIIDEKTLGTVHIANGSNNWFGGSLKSLIHLDHVIKDAMVKIDGRVLRL